MYSIATFGWNGANGSPGGGCGVGNGAGDVLPFLGEGFYFFELSFQLQVERFTKHTTLLLPSSLHLHSYSLSQTLPLPFSLGYPPAGYPPAGYNTASPPPYTATTVTTTTFVQQQPLPQPGLSERDRITAERRQREKEHDRKIMGLLCGGFLCALCVGTDRAAVSLLGFISTTRRRG